MNDAWIPKNWSQLATDIMVSKYFRKAGVPQIDDTGATVLDADGVTVTGPEKSAKQVIHRLAGCWRAWGEKHGYFDTADDAQVFYDELCWMMLNQAAAPKSAVVQHGSPQAYGITGPALGHFVNDPSTGQAMPLDLPILSHACFIQNVDDDLVQPGGIMDLWTREARLFKYGSGTGTNFSRTSAVRTSRFPVAVAARADELLKIGDRAANAIKSGGTTRRTPRWSASMRIIPTSSRSSIGRYGRSSRSPRSSRA